MNADAIAPYLDYLAIDDETVRVLGDLRWTESSDALVYPDSRIFLFTPQLATYLEGFAARQPLLSFGQMLLMVNQFRFAHPRPDVFAVVDSFRRLGQNMRNLGAFLAVIVNGDLPTSHRLPTRGSAAVVAWLHRSPSLGCLASFVSERPAERPALEPEKFVSWVIERINTVPRTTVEHWLAHGSPPAPTLEAPVQAVVQQPLSPVERIVSAMQNAGRLSRALPLVSSFVSAISLPPRRFDTPELPIGGYADIHTRGQPEALLPSQFALDGLEFVRRFAERELLYYRKEEPQQPRDECLTVLVDQGVRTWGSVRLALGAAMLGMARLAERRHLHLGLRVGSAPGECLLLDDESIDTLTTHLEASDLSAHPATLLRAALADMPDMPTDLMVLTHPFAIEEHEFIEVATQVPNGVRLFALTVDEEGQVTLNELRSGLPVVRQRFHVDFRKMDHVRHAPPLPHSQWDGPVEPFGFPFVFGWVHDNLSMAFDPKERWAVSLQREGWIHLVHFTESPIRVEIIPRAMVSGRPLNEVFRVLAVNDGFVVAGQSNHRIVMAYYDLGKRSVQVHTFPERLPPSVSWSWFAIPDEMCVIIKSRDYFGAIDVETGGIFGTQDAVALTSRIERVVTAWKVPRLPAPSIAFDYLKSPMDTKEINLDAPPSILLNQATGELMWDAPSGGKYNIVEDGVALMRGLVIEEAQSAGSQLLVRGRGRTNASRLYVISDTNGYQSFESRQSVARFQEQVVCLLSASGRYLSHSPRGVHWSIQLLEAPGSTPLFRLEPASIHDRIVLEQGSHVLTLQTVAGLFIIRWDNGTMEVTQRPTSNQERGRIRDNKPTSPVKCYDPNRFREEVVGLGRRWLIDRFGQVYLLAEKEEHRWHCAFIVQRNSLAIRLPDGTGWGTPHLLGGAPTPGAEQAIGRVLMNLSPKLPVAD